MKRILISLLCLTFSVTAFAGHIAGGELFYRYLGPGSAPNSSRYSITLRLFRECNPPVIPGSLVADLPQSLQIAIYNNGNPSTQFGQMENVNLTGGIQILALTGVNPCIINPIPICYQVANYQFTKDLPNTANGYIVMYQTCCRTNTIVNVEKFPLSATTSGEGATYTCEIPGTIRLSTGSNSSPVFALKDTALICKSSPFTLDFSATDPDAGDSLSYSFCAAYDRGGTSSSADLNYTSPPFNNVTYTQGFSGSQPIGVSATINPVTGIISGIAPDPGYYVVNVCITEWRKGVAISFHRKDFTMRVTDCTLTAAELQPSYITCNGTVLTFQNESTSSSITSYLWDFGVPGLTNDTSTSPIATYDYLKSGKDSGSFTVKLKVASAGGCQDSATASVNVFPGFTPNFRVQGTCFLNAYQFFDSTVSNYGAVNSWRWNFGDTSTIADTARSKDSVWRYTSARNASVTLITTNTKGCIDTITKIVPILDRPVLNLPFKDTLICSNDSLLLRVNINSGSVVWTPMNGPNQTRITNPTSPTPLVFPQDTTRYYVSVNDNGCANTDSVNVNVLQFISVNAGLDSGICRTDSFRLSPVSDALSYQWAASTGETIQGIKYPMARPLVTTQYRVVANLGKCQAMDSVIINVAPYPAAAAGPDMTICFGTRTQLNATITGTAFRWSPASSLVNENTLTPVAGPVRTTAYVLTVTDTIGCPLAKTDTVMVTVIPPLTAYAGRDTAVLPEQPLQLEATGGTGYEWRPMTGLNNPFIATPIAILNNSIDSIIYTVRVTAANGCASEDQVTVKVFRSGADILVPSGFTPNGDGLNDIARPTTIAITKLIYFSIYNRWGQLLFTTTEMGKGWDGNFNGAAQPSGTYVYQALGSDYLGQIIYRKGTVVLIR